MEDEDKVYAANQEEQPLKSDEPPETIPTYRVYKRRWFILFLVALLAYSSQLLWLSFSPAATVVAEYYNVSDKSINLFSMMYLFLSLPMGFVATYLLDTYGLRPSILLGAWVTAIGSIVRSISVLPFIPTAWSFPMVCSGQVICAMVYPIFISCPPKVSEKWFSSNQRAFATMVASCGFGFFIGNTMPPIIIQNRGVPFLLIVYSIPPVLGALMATFCMCSSAPPTPPSPSAAVQMQPYWTGLKQVVKNRSFLIYVAIMGISGGLYNTFNVIAEEMLCTQGYTPTFIGLALGLQSGIGFIGAILVSLFVDRTKLFEESLKFTQAMASVMSILMFVASFIPNMESVILISIILCGIFSSATYPVCLELAVETSYPVAQGTSVGLLLISMHMQGLIFTFLLESLGRPMTSYQRVNQKCTVHSDSHAGPGSSMLSLLYLAEDNASEPQDMTVAIMVYSGLLCFQVIALMLCFKTNYKRLNAEKLLHAEGDPSVNAEGFQNNEVT
ncbi:solute carrier family 49 member A3-like isoform X1 [Ptychodera flava]|uniref:solute carrier family 49 member A3-like isoform X1 n=1 Tax=Ptychodera flava TaxID=63121 RepID=UPI00396A8225